MNPNNLMEFLQTGFRVGVGATTSLLESLQDEQKREENLADLQLEFNELTQKLAKKGEMTEREARNFVDTIFNQPGATPSESTPETSANPPDSPSSSTRKEPEIQQEIEDLTAQVAALRAELERLSANDADT
ncbi:hypothetical protein [Oxynema aestuarii]|jgi:polyhydroxyalkanoate synthesis regulator phasin|uniref:Phasin family protein n=1 Tax=Oxynema aestuarii AP17 TaxID=2064643 RepID=A0A6H1TWU5_9CYAN|nr:hypothetical protein [Oxynema aestuarii]QIZ70895.1 hypothetical protein HCG48_10105 [Oxynema aestuarii AP17]RMH78386.1 MAG: hypothetical protein D6680_02390 [Cyanobacteria bacterium J007]